MRKAKLDWRLTEADRHNMLTMHRILIEELEAHGIARRVGPQPDLDTVWNAGGQGSWHHIGTTRMSSEPRNGVVDAHCRVHGIANLFVAGSSVFSTSGSSSPTLTIVALALRLAERLRHQV
jgi:choline dehydrogenase-like flavoprotein